MLTWGGVGWWRCCDPQGGKKLTSEQQDIVMTEDRPQTSSNNKPKNQQQHEGPADQGQAAPEGEEPALLVVTAFAGTGKTTTLRAYAEARPDRRSARQAGCRQTKGRQAVGRLLSGTATRVGERGRFLLTLPPACQAAAHPITVPLLLHLLHCRPAACLPLECCTCASTCRCGRRRSATSLPTCRWVAGCLHCRPLRLLAR